MNDPVNDFLAAYAPEVRDLALRVRALILDVLPGTIEQLDTSSSIIAYGYDPTYKGLICAIAPQKSYVNLMFSTGATLADPHGLLEGTGKKARHIKIRTAEQLDNPAVRSLLEAAAEATRKGMKGKG